MQDFMAFFDINNTFFTLLGYPMSYLEFFGTLLNIISVYLVAKNKIWTWPIGNIAVVLFAILFFQIQLYSDFFEQIYFFITGFYGWWVWAKRGKDTEKEMPVSHNSKRNNLIYAGIIGIGTILMGYSISQIHLWLPSIFTLAASFPYLDAFTTVMSFAATILMAHKKIECWYLWISVDIIGIGLYFTKEVVFVSILYVIFLVLASNGLIQWRRIYRKQKEEEKCEED
jgi:nicotinamide mononucleotide transporter